MIDPILIVSYFILGIGFGTLGDGGEKCWGPTKE